jgi:hypothetical protein
MALLGSACFLASAANAQQCDTYSGQTVSPLTFEQAVARVPSVAPRGEYETTAQYEARLAAATGGRGPLIILKQPENRDDYIRYDADNGRLAIQSYAFDNTNFDPWTAVYGTPHARTLNPSTIGNRDVVISSREVPTGTYEGRNAFGARWTVTRITRTIQAIYEGPEQGLTTSLFRNVERSTNIVGYLQMPPEVAQRTKPTLRLAFVVEPRFPFVVRNTYAGRGRITIQNPRDVTESLTMIVGDIQCGLVLDGGNRVLGAYQTR